MLSLELGCCPRNSLEFRDKGPMTEFHLKRIPCRSRWPLTKGRCLTEWRTRCFGAVYARYRKGITVISALLMLQASFALAFAPPVPLVPGMTETSPTAAVRALTVSELDKLPSAPATHTLQCWVQGGGELHMCALADDGGTSDFAVLHQRNIATLDKAKADPTLAAAMARMPFYRVRLSSKSNKELASVLVQEKISAADQAPQEAPIGTIEKDGVELDPKPMSIVAGLYPDLARRIGLEARVTATCRVLSDRSLLCRDPIVEITNPNPRMTQQSIDRYERVFAVSTLKAFAAMRAQKKTKLGEESRGRDVPLAINWTLRD